MSASHQAKPADKDEPKASDPMLYIEGPLLIDQIRAKGWSMRDAAQYLCTSRQNLYRALSLAAPPRLWQCAIAGLPVCTTAIRRALKEERAFVHAQAPDVRRSLKRSRQLGIPDPAVRPETGYAIGEVLAPLEYIGDDFPEGCRCIVRDTRMSGESPEVFIEGAYGVTEWFSTKDAAKLFAQTGQHEI